MKTLSRCAFAVSTLLILSSNANAKSPHATVQTATKSQFHSAESAVIGYPEDEIHVIEAAVIGDHLRIKKKNGKVEELDLTGINSAGKDEGRVSWNLYLFYICKDLWRAMRHQNPREMKADGEKQIGQVNITLVINSDTSHKIAGKVVFVDGEPACSGDKMPPKASKFWKQAKAAVEYVEFKRMKIPDDDAASVTMELIIGRDYERFPHYSSGSMKVARLVRDTKTGKLTKLSKAIVH